MSSTRFTISRIRSMSSCVKSENFVFTTSILAL
ncbi:Uncharacterised protein [Bordetella pertussis]|nr:Uncharacterised protein [Bordetella pertussis]